MMVQMTLREIRDMAKRLRWEFPGKDINIIFEKGRPKLIVY